MSHRRVGLVACNKSHESVKREHSKVLTRKWVPEPLGHGRVPIIFWGSNEPGAGYFLRTEQDPQPRSRRVTGAIRLRNRRLTIENEDASIWSLAAKSLFFVFTKRVIRGWGFFTY